MRSPKVPFDNYPFRAINDLLKSKSISLPVSSSLAARNREVETEDEPGEKLFSEAMEGVRPISRENCLEKIFQLEIPMGSQEREDAEALARLRDLVERGAGFNISDTPEYVEGTGYKVHPEFAKRLHRGDYSIQAHLDLHGLNSEDAREAFEKFMKWAVTQGKRGVLIIHGRGLSSPSEPVLKKKVQEWLVRGPWRKWMIAYASARACDGGAGATYVLLRTRPVSKRFRRKGKSPLS